MILLVKHVNIICVNVTKCVCAARSPAVTTSKSALNIVPLACAYQGAAVSLAVASDKSQQMFRSWS